MSKTPNDNLYTRDHEWVKIEGNKAEVGITDHAQKALGDIVFVELPDLEDEIDAGENSHFAIYAYEWTHNRSQHRVEGQP